MNFIDQDVQFSWYLMMSVSEFEELPHNETYIGDAMQHNDGFLASFMNTHDRGKDSSLN